MDYSVNSYTLHTDTPRQGIKLTRNSRGHWGVTMGNNKGAFVRLGNDNGEDRPMVRDRKVMRAQGYTADAGYKKLVLPPADWPGIIIRIIAQGLDFQVNPLVKNLNLNPGGEGAPVFMQQGAHRDREKDQLFCLENGQRIFVADQKAAVLTITCQRGIPITRPAERAELVEYITAYGLQANTASSVVWAIYTLRDLGAKEHPKLTEHLAALQTK
jgi:hypothetical protein